MRRLNIAFFASIITLSLSASAFSQQNPVGGLVGGLINAAKQSAAKEEWDKVPPIKQTCFNASLQKNRTNVQGLIQSGVGPSDPRLAQINSSCDELINRQFRKDYECSFNINNRSITTWCDEAYAIPGNNNNAQRLTVEEAIAALADGKKLSLGQFEKPDAERRRMQMMQQNPSATTVPKPMWSCDKATKPSEKAICNSYELTMIDNQYGQYWNMAKPLDKKKELQKKNEGFYRAGIACNGNEDCIKRNLITATDTVAEFLKANGTQVSTYTEQQEAKRKADEERAKAEDARRRQLAEQQERARQQQREDDERRLAIAKAEAEKARADADKAKAEADKVRIASSANNASPPQQNPSSGTNTTNEWKKGIEYSYTSDGSCRPSEKKVCLALPEYEQACKEAKHITKYSIKVMAVWRSDPVRSLLENGMVSGYDIKWSPSSNLCRVVINLSGLVNGTSRRVDELGNGTSFVRNDDGLSVSYIE